MSPETKANLGPVQNLGITLGSGVVAGFAAAVLSHVSDSTNSGHFRFFRYNSFIFADTPSLPILCCLRSTKDMVLKVLWCPGSSLLGKKRALKVFSPVWALGWVRTLPLFSLRVLLCLLCIADTL
jgi:hypothetical protein